MFLAGCFDRRLYFVVNDLFGTNTTKQAPRPQLHTHAGHRSHNSVDELGTSAIGLAGPDRLNVSNVLRLAFLDTQYTCNTTSIFMSIFEILDQYKITKSR